MIAGSARGRRLKVPRGRDTRPTSDRVREALFSALADAVPGATVLDCYAGSGALAIEALSRGAAAAVLVEADPRAAAVAAENLARAGVAERATVVRDDVARFCRAPRGGPFDLVFVDAPYAVPLDTLHDQLRDLAAAGGLAPGATVVVERDRRDPALADPVAAPPPLAHERARTYGDTVLVYYRVEEPPSA
ncbi:MAG TPA: 16S rRNA (guanine(966)-N(2))-methyltransferase RsmD [Egibacteraceae bacterium]